MRCAMTRADNRRALKILAFKFGRECFEIHSPSRFFLLRFREGKNPVGAQRNLFSEGGNGLVGE